MRPNKYYTWQPKTRKLLFSRSLPYFYQNFAPDFLFFVFHIDDVRAIWQVSYVNLGVILAYDGLLCTDEYFGTGDIRYAYGDFVCGRRNER